MPPKSKQSPKKHKPRDGFRYPAKDLHRPVTKRDIDELFVQLASLDFRLKGLVSSTDELDPDPVSREEFAELSEYVQYNHFLITTLYKKLGFKVHLSPREGFLATLKDDKKDV